MEIIVKQKPLFFSPKFGIFTNNTFNTPIRKGEKLPVIPSILSITHLKVESNGNCFSPFFLDDDSPPPQKSIKICHEPTR